MSRKSTIDMKDVASNKMIVVLDKNRTGSQKKQEFSQSFSNTSKTTGLMSPTTTQMQNQILQVSVNGAAQKSLKSKLSNKQGNNPFYSGQHPKVLPIEIINQQRHYNQIKTP